MNALAENAPSAWYLTLWVPLRPFGKHQTNDPGVATLFSTDSLYPSHLPRTPDGGYDTSRLWRGCHNSATPLPVELAHIEGLPPSPWESVSKFHLTRCGVYAQVACPGSTARWRSIGSAGLYASQCHGVVLSTSTSVCVLVSSCVQFSRYREGLVKKSLHYTTKAKKLKNGNQKQNFLQNLQTVFCNCVPSAATHCISWPQMLCWKSFSPSDSNPKSQLPRDSMLQAPSEAV